MRFVNRISGKIAQRSNGATHNRVAGKVLNTFKCKVFINPNKDQMRTLYNSTVKILADHGYPKTSDEYFLRMLKFDGHLYVWEGWFGVHEDIIHILKSLGYFIETLEIGYATVSDMEKYGLNAEILFSKHSGTPSEYGRSSVASMKQTAHGKVLINPPKQQWANVAMGFMGGESRILEKDGVFYIWDAGADGAIHYQIALDLGLEAPYKFTMIRKWEGEQIGWDYHRLNELGPHLWHKGKDNPLKHGHLAKVEDVKGARVFVDPSRAQIKALSDHVFEVSAKIGRPNKEMMRLMRNGGHLYIWDGMSALVHIQAVREMALPGITETRIAFPIDLEGVSYDARRIFDRKAPTDYDIELGEDGRARILGGMNVKGADLRSDIIARGAPAVRYQGRVYPGLRGEYHALICEKNNLPGKSEVERGYVIGGKFIPDDSLPQGIDSSELMSPMQKMRVDQDLVRDWRNSHRVPCVSLSERLRLII